MSFAGPGRLAITTSGDGVAFVEASSGDTLDRIEATARISGLVVETGAAVAVGKRLFVADESGAAIQWLRALPAKSTVNALADGVVVLTHREPESETDTRNRLGVLTACDPAGNQLWRYTGNKRIGEDAVRIEDRIVVPERRLADGVVVLTHREPESETDTRNRLGVLTAYDSAGNQLWRYTGNKRIGEDAVRIEDRIVVPERRLFTLIDLATGEMTTSSEHGRAVEAIPGPSGPVGIFIADREVGIVQLIDNETVWRGVWTEWPRSTHTGDAVYLIEGSQVRRIDLATGETWNQHLPNTVIQVGELDRTLVALVAGDAPPRVEAAVDEIKALPEVMSEDTETAASRSGLGLTVAVVSAFLSFLAFTIWWITKPRNAHEPPQSPNH